MRGLQLDHRHFPPDRARHQQIDYDVLLLM